MVSFQDISSRLTRRHTPSAAASAVELVLLRERAAEAPRELGPGDYRIGSQPDCDIVLAEAPAAHFAVLKISREGPDLALAIIPFAAGLTHRGLAAQPFVPLHLGTAAEIGIGRATLRLGATTPASADLPKVRAKAAVPKPVAGRLTAVEPRTMLLAAGLLFGAAFVSSMLDTGFPLFRSPVPGSAAPAGETKVADAGEMMTLIRQQLTAADLADTLRANYDGKTILIEGAVSDRQEDRYRLLLAALRRRSPVEIRSQVQPVASPLHSQIAGVALAPVALVVMQDGGRFRVGDTMPKGWRVEAINDQGVILARDAMRVTVPLGGR